MRLFYEKPTLALIFHRLEWGNVSQENVCQSTFIITLQTLQLTLKREFIMTVHISDPVLIIFSNIPTTSQKYRCKAIKSSDAILNAHD